MWQESADLVALNEEILNGKLHFLCSESESIDSTNPTTRLLVWGNLVRKKFLLLSKFFSNISTPKEPFIWMISWNILILNQLDFYNNDISNLLIIKQVKKKMRDKSKKNWMWFAKPIEIMKIRWGVFILVKHLLWKFL